MALKVLANAKINWTLDIVGMLPNGYHRLDMLLQSINIADELHFEESAQLTLTIDSLSPITLQNDDNNLVLKAANALRCYADCKNGARIHLKKSIPILAGLGGGSSDAAATLVGLNVLWDLQLSSNELTQIGAKLGADIPFCIQGGLQRAEGFGQLLTPLCQLNPFLLIIIKPTTGLSTKDVFARFDTESYANVRKPNNEKASQALKAHQFKEFSSCFGNVLESAACSLNQEVRLAIQDLYEAGAVYAQMTGSGSAVFGIFDHQRIRQNAFEVLLLKWENCYLAETTNEGIRVIPLDS